ncbi:DUF5644 domain-containing protein [Sulfurospirillum sp. T05]|uniref:DUF5644 domain-containing protein n=1 Tax=Sulfurospirillum tamanense TaxID=2813362 RepID=A0ABS2WT63_9BACT|nr:DUF5644 domain-containing protein [Sulfurospirillum tamanensis]MBN2964568.1 DUF5644 domain-containing protein [Sulfurospirillum tamanensis]
MTFSFSVSIFRFNAKTDYLPYYKKHTLTFSPQDSLAQALAQAKTQDPLFDYPQGEHAAVKVNGVALSTTTSLQDIKATFGTELTIDALSSKRATKDLIIDTQDFYERFDLLAPYVQKVDREYFESLICLHYGSETLAYNPRFYGAAFFVFAKEMMEKYYEFKDQILAVVADPENGIWLHTPLAFTVFPAPANVEECVDALKNALAQSGVQAPQSFTTLSQQPATTTASLLEILGIADTAEPLDAIAEALGACVPKHPFSKFKTALFLGQTSDAPALERFIAFSGAKSTALSRTHQHCGAALFPHAKEIALKMGGDILLEAFDAGCDFVLVNDPLDFAFLETNQTAISKALNREVKIPVLTPAQLVLLSLGEFDKAALSSHTVKPTFID